MNKTIQVIQRELNKKFGANTLVLADEAVGLTIRYFGTGSKILDIALNGGWALGRMNELVGHFSAYKTTLAYIGAKNFLAVGGDMVVWVDMERSFERRWAKFLGLDTSKLVLVQPDSGEEAVDVCAEAMRSMTGKRILLVVDSIAMLVPTAEAEGDADKGLIGAHPRLVSRMIRKLNAVMKSNLVADFPQTTVLFLNQVRMQVGVMYGDPETVPGGKALEHGVSIRVKLRRKEFIFSELKDGTDEAKQVVGARLAFTVLKNKTGGAQQEKGLLTFYNRDFNGATGGCVDNASDMLPLGILYGLIKKNGHSFQFGKHKALGRDNFAIMLRDHPDVLEELADQINSRHNRLVDGESVLKRKKIKEVSFD